VLVAVLDVGLGGGKEAVIEDAGAVQVGAVVGEVVEDGKLLDVSDLIVNGRVECLGYETGDT